MFYMKNARFTPVNIERSTFQKLKRMKIARSFTTGKVPTYSQMIDDMINDVEKVNPVTYKAYVDIMRNSDTDE